MAPSLPKETAPRKSLCSFMSHSSTVFRRCVPLVSWDLIAVSYLFVSSLPVMYLLIAFRATSLQLTSRYFSIFLAVSSSILTVRFFVILGQPTHSSVHTHSIKPSCVVCSQKSTRPPSCTHTLHVRVRACARGCK